MPSTRLLLSSSLAAAGCLVIAAALKVPAEPVNAAAKPATAGAAAEITAVARDFLAVLEADQKPKAMFALTDEERQNWHFVPLDNRKGITLAELRPDQDHLAYALLESFLSHAGFRKATAIMSLEKILFDLENGHPRRNPEKYYLSIFGEPDAVKPWGFRFEGHHFSMNATLADGSICVTPTFMGANPGVVPEGKARAGLEVLGDEDRLGMELARTLTEDQKKEAVLPGAVPADILTGDARKVKGPLSPAGISGSKLDAAQRETLWRILSVQTSSFRSEIASQALERLKAAGDGALTFAWAGGTQAGQGHYYRIQGADFLFEFDNTQNEARHPHAVWRDLRGDFGEDLLAAHLRSAHGK